MTAMSLTRLKTSTVSFAQPLLCACLPTLVFSSTMPVTGTICFIPGRSLIPSACKQPSAPVDVWTHAQLSPRSGLQ
ncbi:hypothetical protein BCR44DRAFT_1437481 [Catenaria anguillulae PL171]|uniref:Secreted protein n=1 Tax=Catenaria anguillulae PL171 TaxID=765915 RepID=A0A1Y2HGP9_9FUNG|nr:hypothetical protein BCR44DRAFT_1437481 [Catenaria anguillulae PL171]